MPVNRWVCPLGGLIWLSGFLWCYPTVAADCSLQATPLVFGTYNPLAFGSPRITSTITVTCRGLAADVVSYEIRLSHGVASGFGQRKMRSGASALDYQVYTDSAMTKVWGDGTGSTAVVRGRMSLSAGIAQSISYTAYGRLASNQSVFPGAYLDPVSATLVMEFGGHERSTVSPHPAPFLPVQRGDYE